MSSAWFIWAVLVLQAGGGAYCVAERDASGALIMTAGVLVQAAILIGRTGAA